MTLKGSNDIPREKTAKRRLKLSRSPQRVCADLVLLIAIGIGWIGRRGYDSIFLRLLTYDNCVSDGEGLIQGFEPLLELLFDDDQGWNDQDRVPVCVYEHPLIQQGFP